MSDEPDLLPAAPVPTSTESGGRKWVFPRRSRGRFFRQRQVIAAILIALYAALPHIRINGLPAMFLDIPARRFTLFGVTFWPTDTLLLALLGIGTVLSIVAVTAILGRVWCGWGCPQTIYMEFVFRPIETWLEGEGFKKEKFDNVSFTPGKLARKLLKWALFAIIAFVLSNTFLAYFVSTDRLLGWMSRSPAQHSAGFAIMLGLTIAIVFDFAWFRELMCTLVCPYGRLQSVMTDDRTIQVSYDAARGEPRGKLQRGALAPGESRHGDCLDCKMCVQTCPTGIDIRDGLQLECIGCTQCIDACDRVMIQIEKPFGLIRYASAESLRGNPSGLLKPRLFLYAAVISVIFSVFVYLLAVRPDARVTVLRAVGGPYQLLPDEQVSNHMKIRISNRGFFDRSYLVVLDSPADGKLFMPMNPMQVTAGDIGTADAFVMLSSRLVEAHREIVFRIEGDDGGVLLEAFTFLGPENGEGR